MLNSVLYRPLSHSLFVFLFSVEVLLNSVLQYSKTVFALCFSINVFLFCLLCLKRKKIPIFFLILICVSAVYYSLFPNPYMRSEILSYCLLCMIFYLSVDSLNRDMMLLRTVYSIGVVHCSLCILEFFLKKNLFLDLLGFSGKYDSSMGRVSGLTTHPIPAAFFALVVLLLSLLFYRVRGQKKYILYGFIALCAIILTQSRSAYLFLVIAALIYMLMQVFFIKKETSKKRVVGFISLIIFGCVLVIYSSLTKGFLYEFTFGRFLQLGDVATAGSLLQRVGSMDFILNYLGSSIFRLSTWCGHGFGGLYYYLISHDIWFVKPDYYLVDNQYISFIYDIGIIGIVVLLFLTARQVVEYLDIYFKTRNANVEISIIPLLMFLSILFVIFFFEFYGFPICILLFPLITAFTNVYIGKYESKELEFS